MLFTIESTLSTALSIPVLQAACTSLLNCSIARLPEPLNVHMFFMACISCKYNTSVANEELADTFSGLATSNWAVDAST